jgi:hypothetical protein
MTASATPGTRAGNRLSGQPSGRKPNQFAVGLRSEEVPNQPLELNPSIGHDTLRTRQNHAKSSRSDRKLSLKGSSQGGGRAERSGERSTRSGCHGRSQASTEDASTAAASYLISMICAEVRSLINLRQTASFMTFRYVGDQYGSGQRERFEAGNQQPRVHLSSDDDPNNSKAFISFSNIFAPVVECGNVLISVRSNRKNSCLTTDFISVRESKSASKFVCDRN